MPAPATTYRRDSWSREANNVHALGWLQKLTHVPLAIAIHDHSCFNSSQKAGPESEIASTQAVIASNTRRLSTCGQPIGCVEAIDPHLPTGLWCFPLSAVTWYQWWRKWLNVVSIIELCQSVMTCVITKVSFKTIKFVELKMVKIGA